MFSPPITQNKDVAALLSLLEANHMPGAEDLRGVIRQVGRIEQHLGDMVKELGAVREQLAEAQRQNHPIRNALQKAVTVMQGNLLDLRDKLGALKQDIAAGCKSALEAAHDKGLSALRGIAKAFNLRPALEALRGDIEKAIEADTRSIRRIETVSAEYHKAGRAVKNIARAAAGIDIRDEVKPMGVLAKAATAPLRADRHCALMMGNCVNRAIGAIGRLERTGHKEPVMETIEKLDGQIKAAQKDMPARVRSRPEPAAER
jgi:hypothetical protein